ncbi:MAG: class I SAM-dependent methyltransferase [Treponema sp.]|jgi:2-polyprenyl-3-methyl-5-hydroxy-6-metoxy-1,4-benzoquinol methylase|nr:class I SAM-dependent methyltransferase [Treponema sp.]
MMSCQQPGAGAEVESVDPVWEKNFNRIFQMLKTKFSECKTILDVGSSRGTFLKLAKTHDFPATGLEPDAHLAEQCRSAGLEVITGFFPAADELNGKTNGKTFDVVIFNNSFEHIPDLNSILTGIKKYLNPNGVTIVHLPCSSGLMFQAAFFLYKKGMSAPFDRLWQKGFASPHLHYFNPANLKILFEKYGFIQKESKRFSFFVIKGLWRRIRCKSSLVMSIAAWFILVVLYPLFAIKSDCFVSYFTPENGKGG